jgi:hypothetical protein
MAPRLIIELFLNNEQTLCQLRRHLMGPPSMNPPDNWKYCRSREFTNISDEIIALILTYLDRFHKTVLERVCKRLFVYKVNVVLNS